MIYYQYFLAKSGSLLPAEAYLPLPILQPSSDPICNWLRAYEGCPENIQPFWISREPIVWTLC